MRREKVLHNCVLPIIERIIGICDYTARRINCSRVSSRRAFKVSDWSRWDSPHLIVNKRGSDGPQWKATRSAAIFSEGVGVPWTDRDGFKKLRYFVVFLENFSRWCMAQTITEALSIFAREFCSSAATEKIFFFVAWPTRWETMSTLKRQARY